MGASPDGIVWESGSVGALEIKCCQSVDRMHSVEKISQQFYDQLQGEMAILSAALQLDVQWCDFFVWCPHRRVCKRIRFDPDYFHNNLLPNLRRFYFGCYVPVARRMPVCASGVQIQHCVRRLVRESGEYIEEDMPARGHIFELLLSSVARW